MKQNQEYRQKRSRLWPAGFQQGHRARRWGRGRVCSGRPAHGCHRAERAVPRACLHGSGRSCWRPLSNTCGIPASSFPGGQLSSTVVQKVHFMENSGVGSKSSLADILCLSRKCTVCSVQSSQFSRSVLSDSLRPHEPQRARPPCPSLTPGVHSDSRPSNQ